MIPVTKGKLSSTISLYAMVSPNLTVTAYENYGSSTFYTGEKVNVGAVLSLSRGNTREPDRIYALGKNAFEPLRVVPTPITTDLTLSRVILYESDALEALGYPHGNLFYQQNPFLLEEKQYQPYANGQPIELRTITYFDCWFKTNPVRYDIRSEDQLVIQEDVGITCGVIRSSDVEQVVEASRTVDLVGGKIGGAVNWVKGALKLKK